MEPRERTAMTPRQPMTRRRRRNRYHLQRRSPCQTFPRPRHPMPSPLARRRHRNLQLPRPSRPATRRRRRRRRRVQLCLALRYRAPPLAQLGRKRITPAAAGNRPRVRLGTVRPPRGRQPLRLLAVRRLKLLADLQSRGLFRSRERLRLRVARNLLDRQRAHDLLLSRRLRLAPAPVAYHLPPRVQ